MVACGPRKKGSKPGKVLVGGRPARSAAVYRGLTEIPSGVIQLSAATSPLGADLAAALAQACSCSGVAELEGDDDDGEDGCDIADLAEIREIVGEEIGKKFTLFIIIDAKYC